MTTRTPGRHRAARSPITPLTPVRAAAARGIAATARRGAVVAAGSGLLVSLLGATADAATTQEDQDVSTAELETVTPAVRTAALQQDVIQRETAQDVLRQETLQQDTLQEAILPEETTRDVAQQVTVAPTVRVAADSDLSIETGTVPVTPAPEPEPVVEVAEPAEETVAAAPVEEPAAPEPAVEEPAVEEEVAPAAAGSDIIAIAEQYLGVPYVWGGSTPAGFDCSGFTSYVYAQIGITLPRTSSEQRYAGTVVSQAEAQPGDLIWSPGHIALYAGGDQQIEAPVPGQSVHYSTIWQDSPVFIRVA